MASDKDRWEIFREKYSNKIESLKKEVVITIYGSYCPPLEKSLLISLKQKLVQDGYEQACLVEDKQTTEDDPLEISKMCLLFSDINFLIFTKEGKRYGVVRELAFMAESSEMSERIQNCTVFDEIIEGNSSIPKLTLSDIHNIGVELRTFNNKAELETAILAKAYWHLHRLSKTIQRRVIHE